MRPLPDGKHISVGRAGVDYAQRAPAKKAIWSATRNRLARLAHPTRDLRSNRRVGQSGPSVPTWMAGGSIHRSQACLTRAPASAHRVVVYIDTGPHYDIRLFHGFIRDIPDIRTWFLGLTIARKRRWETVWYDAAVAGWEARLGGPRWCRSCAKSAREKSDLVCNAESIGPLGPPYA